MIYIGYILVDGKSISLFKLGTLHVQLWKSCIDSYHEISHLLEVIIEMYSSTLKEIKDEVSDEKHPLSTVVHNLTYLAFHLKYRF